MGLSSDGDQQGLRYQYSEKDHPPRRHLHHTQSSAASSVERHGSCSDDVILSQRTHRVQRCSYIRNDRPSSAL